MNYLIEARSALIVASLYSLLFVAVEFWSRRSNPDVELTRKSVHIGAGVIAIGFPWLFQSHYTVLLLALLFVGVLLVTRRVGGLGSVQGVERLTIGEILYPLSIYITLFLSGLAGEVVLYLIPLLILALADAVAGLVGRKYGRRIYTMWGDQKSAEGSGAFFAIAFLVTVAGLLVFERQGTVDALATALVVAAITTFLEAVSPKGTDNLTIPLGTLCGLYALVA